MIDVAASALGGLKVIDLTRVLGGPYCTQLLGDYGAEVIKIEPPQGDEVRDWGPPFDDQHDASYFIGVNRNKRALGLDLSEAEGRDVLLRLIDDADVLIENYKPGAMERWGLGYEDVLKKRNPHLIHCRISGFGSDGPLGGLPGYDAVIQAMCGMFSINGMPAGPDGDDEGSGRTRIGIPLVDIGTGLFSAIGILMAVIERQRSGQGQFIDMTLHDAGIALMHPHIPNYVLSGKTPALTGNAHPNISPYDKYPTATVDVFLAIGNDRAFGRLCTELEAPDLADDPLFRSNGDRVTNRAALTGRLLPLLADQDGEALCTRLLAKGVPAGPVRDVAEVWSSEHARHRGMSAEFEGYRGWGLPIKFSRSPGRIERRPPRFGEHTRELLLEAGLDDEAIDGLIERGVVLETRRR